MARCERCGKRHIGEFVWLELNSHTGQYGTPGSVPANQSQGLFRFGRACAAAVRKAHGINHRIQRRRRK